MATLTINNTVCNITYASIEYGLIYDWYSVTNAKELANDGWRVSTNADWDNLITYLGGIAVAGAKLQTTSADYCHYAGATDEVGFGGKITGGRSYADGTFAGRCFVAAYGMYDGGYYRFYAGDEDIIRIGGFAAGTYSSNGVYIRLVKETTTLANGETGTYIGNDGLAYRSICINGVEWLQENLAETKYRNGTVIPEITDNTLWVDDVTGALCAYGNDWNDVGRTKPAYY